MTKKIINDICINYELEGEGKTIVFVHGLSDSLEYWKVLSENLKNDYQTLIYDLRGHGVHPVGRLHKVEITGLQPGTDYRYRVMNRGVKKFSPDGDIEYMRPSGSDVYRKSPYVVRTLRADVDTVRFDVYNDMHEKDSLLGVMMASGRKNLDFVMCNGDMVNTLSRKEKIMDRFLKTAAKALKGETPLYVARGNHEMRGR